MTVPTDVCGRGGGAGRRRRSARRSPKPRWIPGRAGVRRDQARGSRRRRPPATRFEILTPKAQPEWPGKKRDEDKSAEGSEGGGGGDLHPDGEADDRKEGPEDAKEEEEDGGAAEEASAEEDDGEPFSSQTRWLIKAGEATQILVRFASDAEGEFAHPLAFECVGGTRAETLELRGRSAFPSISDDYRVVHRKRTRATARTRDRPRVRRPPALLGSIRGSGGHRRRRRRGRRGRRGGSVRIRRRRPLGSGPSDHPAARARVFEFGPLLNNRGSSAARAPRVDGGSDGRGRGPRSRTPAPRRGGAPSEASRRALRHRQRRGVSVRG